MPVDLVTIAVRPERPDDEAFLRAVYTSTREDELNAWGLPPEMRTAFLDMQFKAQQCGYRTGFPKGEFLVILLAGKTVGRMVIDRGADEWCLVDIALLVGYRSQGIGTVLIRRLAAEAAAAGKPLGLSVIKGNQAFRFYKRLGFVKTGESGMHDLMEWRAENSRAKNDSSDASQLKTSAPI